MESGGGGDAPHFGANVLQFSRTYALKLELLDKNSQLMPLCRCLVFEGHVWLRSLDWSKQEVEAPLRQIPLNLRAGALCEAFRCFISADSQP